MANKSKPSATPGSQAKKTGNSQPKAQVSKNPQEPVHALPERKPQMAFDQAIPKAKLMHVVASADRSKLKKKKNN